MNKLIAAIATIGLALPTPLLAEVDQKVSAKCSEEIFNVNQEMEKQYKVRVSQPYQTAAAHPMNPFPDSDERWFAMITNYNDENPYVKRAAFNAENLMNSKGIQLRLASRVFQSCPSTSIIGFGFQRSGYWIKYFRMPSGQVREGIDLGCGRESAISPSTTLQWGYYQTC